MLRDLITAYATRCSPSLRHLGYLDETLAMRRRYRARKEAWRPHLERSRQFILASARSCRNRNKIVILGSGLLLDVPLAELSRLFTEVVLLDVICLPAIRKEIGRYPNARFAEYDATGVSEQLYRQARVASPDLPTVSRPASPEFDNADLVVSLNLLSQLWVIPRAFVLKQRTRPDQEYLDDWCGKLVEEHDRFLRSLSCAVCLIGDYEFIERDRTGAVISRSSTVYNVTLPGPAASWTWNIAPLGTASRSFSKELVVGGWNFGV